MPARTACEESQHGAELDENDAAVTNIAVSKQQAAGSPASPTPAQTPHEPPSPLRRKQPPSYAALHLTSSPSGSAKTRRHSAGRHKARRHSANQKSQQQMSHLVSESHVLHLLTNSSPITSPDELLARLRSAAAPEAVTNFPSQESHKGSLFDDMNESPQRGCWTSALQEQPDQQWHQASSLSRTVSDKALMHTCMDGHERVVSRVQSGTSMGSDLGGPPTAPLGSPPIDCSVRGCCGGELESPSSFQHSHASCCMGQSWPPKAAEMGVPDDVQMRLGSVATSESPLQSQRRPVFITSFDLLSSPPPSLLPFYHE